MGVRGATAECRSRAEPLTQGSEGAGDAWEQEAAQWATADLDPGPCIAPSLGKRLLTRCCLHPQSCAQHTRPCGQDCTGKLHVLTSCSVVKPGPLWVLFLVCPPLSWGSVMVLSPQQANFTLTAGSWGSASPWPVPQMHFSSGWGLLVCSPVLFPAELLFPTPVFLCMGT